MLVRLPVEKEPEVLLDPDQPELPPEAEQLFALLEFHRTVVAPLKDKLVLSAVMSTVGCCTCWPLTFTVTESEADPPELFVQVML